MTSGNINEIIRWLFGRRVTSRYVRRAIAVAIAGLPYTAEYSPDKIILPGAETMNVEETDVVLTGPMLGSTAARGGNEKRSG